MSADGLTLAIGAYKNHGVNGFDSSLVRVYLYTSNAWNQFGGDIDGEASNDNFSSSGAMSAYSLTLAIGAANNDGVNGHDSDNVRVYKYTSNAWNKIGDEIDGEADGDYSDVSVAMSAEGLLWQLVLMIMLVLMGLTVAMSECLSIYQMLGFSLDVILMEKLLVIILVTL